VDEAEELTVEAWQAVMAKYRNVEDWSERLAGRSFDSD
jgi:hypothetical protein